MMKHVSIDPLYLRLALSKANRRSVDRDYIYSTLDAALRHELGRITKTEPPVTECPADIDSVPYREDTFYNGEKRVRGWWKIVNRNPTDERNVFLYFRDYLRSFVDGGKLSQLFPVQISEDAAPKIRDWISDKEAELSTKVSNKEQHPTRNVKRLADFLIVEDKDALMRKIEPIIKNAKGKKAATLILALMGLGWLDFTSGECAALCNALNDEYGTQLDRTSVARYLSDGTRRKAISDNDIAAITTLLQA